MFANFSQALAAEHLPAPTPEAGQEQAAAVAVARGARDKRDLVQLLEALGLPTDEDTLTGLLAHLTDRSTDRELTGDVTPMTTQNAFEAMAVSMYYADQTMAEITQATGLSEAEITALVDAQERQFDVDATADTTTPATSQADTAGVAGLLAWADGHELAGIRNRAARIRTDLAELSARCAAEAATRQAEERVAKLKAELEAAQAELRQAKTGRPAAVPAAAAPARRGTPGKSRKELAAIRTWARANGHTVADHGMIPKKIVAAYEAAHAELKQAG
ncbi:histone-like nucleoid-structuring protein Lsr2 [Streptomyces sp. TRM 70361]|uniref:Lsr2 family DNA-binding protein n=1 Tax=Streptomyces sp. TRM 70361 TaxID=3116553 RepID=UPI002E7B4B83|nr:histone-like nucleoid-structuring protein Lsr2 [Streptomyces sp. TRM 70361]MEE1943283.1 histone-like nucleoid-structuring protein Lsr2 [Streptomyces sp. TRM 70361]